MILLGQRIFKVSQCFSSWNPLSSQDTKVWNQIRKQLSVSTICKWEPWLINWENFQKCLRWYLVLPQVHGWMSQIDFHIFQKEIKQLSILLVCSPNISWFKLLPIPSFHWQRHKSWWRKEDSLWRRTWGHPSAC